MLEPLSRSSLIDVVTLSRGRHHPAVRNGRGEKSHSRSLRLDTVSHKHQQWWCLEYPTAIEIWYDKITGNYFEVSNFRLLLDKITSYFSIGTTTIVGQGLLIVEAS